MKAASVSVPNQSGTYKKFRTLDARGVAEWRNSYDEIKRRVPTVPTVSKVQKDKDLYEAGECALAGAFDGRDPIDLLQPFLRKNGMTFHDLDRVYQNRHKMNYYDHLALMWYDHQSDCMSDARSLLQEGKFPADSEYYTIEHGKVVPSQNPWRST